MPADDADAMNLRAYMALAGASMDWRDDLARLLRSDVPLDRPLRDRLASLVDNVTGDGPRLELTGYKAAKDRFAGIASRQKWMEIGRWVSAYQKPDPSSPNATQAAAEFFVIGLKAVEAAVAYFNKAYVWIDRAMESEAGQTIGREWVERLYHSIIVSPETKRLNDGLLRQFGLLH